MYKKFETSWLKHIDFLLVDVLGLQLGFTIAYLLSFVIFNWDASYFGDLYFQISMMLLVSNGCAGFLDEGYHNILRRDYVQESKVTLKHVMLIMAMMLLYFILLVKLLESILCSF